MSARTPSGLEVAVIGLAGRFPGARDLDAFWRNLSAAVESVRLFSPAELRALGAGEALLADPAWVPAKPELADVDCFDAEVFGVNPREAEIMDPQQRLFLECAFAALDNAGYGGEKGGAVGVYAGASLSHYLLYHLASRPDVAAAAGGLGVVLGNDKDYLATKTSYKLDLEGPAVGVQTACSTSLVALHLACQGLIDGDCDLALAGAVALDLSPVPGYRYQKDGILSPDGHCRAFDAGAGGTIFGSGVGAVVLKRLEDALADGDAVRAVILGTAINNDGAGKVGFTAPRLEGQERVIRAALAAARVDPRTIGYVEAHGTATPLGDPIEVAALSRAFRDAAQGGAPRPGACALGSVKTNVGHLDTAAGMAGLIKTVLALEHGEIPPSLHFEAPNPHLEIESSPFRVATSLEPWAGNGAPRRAGVSSFGIGGTNAHVILEQAPAPPPTAPARPRQLLLLAAAGPEALDRATDALAAHLGGSDVPLADAAYTLALGRRRFPHRRALVAGSRAGAARILAERDPERLLEHFEEPSERPLVFLFPGQGSQHPGMSRDLYDAEPVFRREVDEAAEKLREALGRDLRELLCGDPADEEAAALLRRTDLAQPALFVHGWAAARLLTSWGLAPEAMLGHSIGELAAAAMAGVFELDDALALVAERGRLMGEQPPGAMLSVAAPAAELLPELPRGVSVAAVNGPRMTVLAGSAEEIDACAVLFAGRGVEHRRLHTSHAFHSTLMGPAVAPFERAVAGRGLAAPRFAFLSNVTGTWITAAEATDPGYWARQLRQPVRFGDGLTELFTDRRRVLLELGPGRALTTLAQAHPEKPRDTVALSAGRPPADVARGVAGDEHAHLLATLGRLWLVGIEPSWRRFFAGEKRRRVALPTYPFERRRFWIERPGAGTAAPAARRIAEEETPAPAAGHHRPALGVAYEAPRSATERRIARIWGEALGIAEVGAHDPFLELGGHSLLATRVTARLEAELGVEVAVRELFADATVARLAATIDARLAAGGGARPALPELVADPARRHEPFPLTDVQQAYWIGRGGSFEIGNVATYFYTEIDVRGLDLERLNDAFVRLVERHEMLRAVIDPDGRQRILERVEPYRFALLDLSRAAAAEAEEALAARRHEMSHQILPADRWPLFDVRASRLPGGRLRLHLGFDFLVGDAWTVEVLRREWLLLYADPETSLEPLGVSFRDYVLAEEALREEPLYRRSLEYWRARLPGLPGGPELPLARDPASLGLPRFTRRGARLDAGRWTRLKERAATAGVTPSVLLLGAFAETLARWSARPHFLLTLTLFRRLPFHAQVDALVGDFTSLTLLEVDHRRPTSFAERARALQARLLADLDHRYVSGVRVLRELAQRSGGEGRGPAVPVVFTSLLGLPEGGGEAGGALPEAEHVYSISQTPQVWIDHQVSESRGELVYNWDAVEELFPSGLLDDLFAAYRDLLERLAEAETWTGLLLRLPAAQLARRREPEAAEGAPTGLLHRRVFAAARRDPEAPAVYAAGRRLSHGELRARALRLAAELRRRGARPDTLVAVVMEKGWEQVVAVLGVLEAGAAYLPIDPALPPERVAHLLARGQVATALTLPSLRAELEAAAAGSAVAWLAVSAEEPPGAPAEEGPPAATPEDLAYVIFTSGSTGAPKGVMIDHRGAVNTVLDVNRRFAVGPEDRVLALSSLSFDLSVYDLFGVLAAGAAVVIPEPGAARRPDEWLALAARHGVTIWSSVPALLLMMVEHLEAMGAVLPESVRLVMLSGDWIPVALPDRLRAVSARPAAALSVVSLGGATEASIWSIAYEIGEVDPSWPSIPYGRAMTRQSFQVFDGDLEPRPEWAPGQLFIGGVGVARGYWRDPARTAASFVPDPRNGERLYKTGDLGRYLGDGTIEFLGREDQQVKIRGHRVELGEIEAALGEHPGVAAAAVVAVGDRHRRRLVAAAVPAPGAAVDGEALAEHLGAKVPAYMVPASWLLLEAMPLTANGKVDRKALERLAEAERGEAAASADRRREEGPRGELEELLARIWREVLKVGAVDRGANFFALGGDSILAIQIVARARQEGLDCSLDQVFLHPTVAELAAAVAPVAAGAASADPEAPVSGPLPLTPIQAWFFEHRFARPGHWNQAAMLAVRRPLAPGRLYRAVALLERHHDALRLRFAAGAATGWRAWNAPPETAPPCHALDLSGLPPERGRGVLEAAAAALQQSLDLVRGPLFRVAYFDTGGEGRLLLIFHHLVVDGLSWRVLIEDLGRACGSLEAGVEPLLPPRTDGFKRWAETLDALAWSGRFDAERAYWASAARRRAVPLPVDFERARGRNLEGMVETVGVELDEEATRRLLHEAPATLRATIDEVLLAAAARALGRFAGGPVLVDVEAHGREEVVTAAAGLDVSRTVGWFTAVYPLLLDPASGGALGALAATKEVLRSVPSKGIGWGVLRYLDPRPEVAAELAGLPAAEVGFNYLGQLDQVTAGDDALFGGAPEPTGPWNAPELERRHLVFIFGSTSGGRLRMGWAYSPRLLRRGTVEALAADFKAALEELADATRPAAAVRRVAAWTASDFPLARLEAGELRKALEGVRFETRDGAPAEIEDVYALAPLQEGLLFHGLYGETSDLYVTTFAATVPELRPEVFEAAWQAVVDRHPALRTAFVWEDLERPVQVVGRRVAVPCRREDWRDLPAAERRRRLSEDLRGEAARVAPFNRGPLLRLSLFRTGESEHVFVFSHHHLILDGWSLPLLLGEVLAAYEAGLDGAAPRLATPRPFRDFIAWLARRDQGAARAAWRRILAGFEAPNRVGFDRGEPGAEVRASAVREIRLPAAPLARLTAALRRRGLTLNTAVQGTWALVLSRSGGGDDVVFGMSVAGRPPEIEGVETVLGVFTNTLPLRCRVEVSRPAAVWLETVQAAQVEARRYEWCPLAEIRKESGLRDALPLFESVLVFENYPAPEGSPGVRLELRDVATALETNYPLLVNANPGGDGLALALTYDARRFAATDVVRLLGHWRVLLGALAADPDVQVGALPWLGEAERHQLLREWNDTERRRSADATLDELVRATAAAAPEAVALVVEGARMTYGELLRRSELLARRLAALGVEPETRVALAAERSLERMAGLMAIHAAGGVYVPVDPEDPRRRLELVLEDSGAAVLLARAGLAERLADVGIPVLRLDAEGRAPERPPRRAAPANAAYVIYTSGSTGRPKGVAVSHRAIVSRLRAMVDAFALGAGDVFLQKTPHSFDVSIWELFLPLAVGARSVIARPGGHREPDYLARRIVEERVSVVHFVPSLLRVFVEEDAASRCVSLRHVIASGEALPRELVRRFSGRLAAPLVNLYGPTEAAIDVTAWRCSPGEAVPIGRPEANVAVYLVDRRFRVAPIGVPAELLIGGVQVARGYLGRSGLTAERFVPDPWGADPGARLYRTGDLTRRRGDGAIEFLGRIDHQVKVRGLRIELGEIEAVLLEHPGVRETAVIAHADGETTRLVAYWAAAGDPPPAADELRAHLVARLPDHMVPAAFAALDALPLNASGKVDRSDLARRALPIPERRGAAAPRTHAEAVLAEVWAEVLRLGEVGIDEDFFRLGGDSILSIRVVTRALRRGLRVTPQQIFERRTVAAVAAAAEPAGGTAAEQGPVVGAVPLLPVQRRFLAADPADAHHFNQALALAVTRRLDPGVLEQALAVLLAHHDALRLRFARDEDGWRQWSVPPGGAVPFAVVDLRVLPAERRAEARAAAAGRCQASLDLGEGPLARLLLYPGGEAEDDRLLWIVHHLAVDGVSWRILVEDLELSYLQLERSGRLDLPPKTTSFKAWAELLAARARSPESAEAAALWRRSLGDAPRPLPLDEADAAPLAATAATLWRELDAETTAALLTQAPRAYGTEVNDALLAAFALALGRFTGETAFWVELEGHGREEGAADGATAVDLSRTVGWLTTLFPLRLEVDAGGVGGTLRATKERLRRLPERGLTWGLLELREEGPPVARRPEIVFNYLGRLDRAFPEGSIFRPAGEGVGALAGPRQARAHLLEVNGGVRDGRLGLAFTYAAALRRERVGRLADAYVDALRELVAHCHAEGAGGYTPSDFPLMDFDQAELDDLAGDLAGSLEGGP